MRKPAFTLEQARSFVAVAETESISKAAHALSLSQGAVTQQVRNFERALGVQLVERGGGRIRLTGAGLEVAASCRALVESLEAVQQTARRFGSLQDGALLVGASPTAAAHYLPALLDRFSRRHPGIGIKVVTDNTPRVAAAVAAGELDCGLVEGPTGQADLVEQPLAADELVAVVKAGHPLARLATPDPAELRRHVYLAREPGASLDFFAARMLGSGFSGARRMEFGHLDAVRGAVLAGLGFTVLPRIAIARALAERRLVQLPWPALERSISAVRRPASGAATLEAFWKLLLEPEES